ncbi:MAG: mannan endo,4-beta-mannosidase [Solirubrobacteraceae bacterium]|nr:mannan endo,4-beta-mannosidase [Solirubrobacteraceae bacterium]
MDDSHIAIRHLKTGLAVATTAACFLLTLAAPAAINGTFAAAASSGVSSAAFVHRSSNTLTLAGQAWRFVGFNDYQLTSQPGGGFYCGRTVDQRTLDAVLQDAKTSGASVVRTWFFQSYYDRDAQGHTVSPSWSAFDRVLNAAAAHGLKVIPVLVNEWQDCEPASINKNLGFFQSGYKSPGYGYPLSFKTFATTVAGHYAANPTVAFWQIGNELESNTSSGCSPADEAAGAGALRLFADDVTATIKHADPNHLVSLGTIGSGQCGLAGGDYQYVHAGAVDVCEYHDYGDAVHAIPDDGYNRLAQRIVQCRSLNKPLFVGESGIVADVGESGQSTGTISSTSLELRAGFFDAKLVGAFDNGIAGYMLWDKQQDASNSAYNLNNGRYSVGPSSIVPDPTNAVTASVAGSFGAVAGTLRFGFEDGGTDGWDVAWQTGSLSLSNASTQAWAGGHSLGMSLHGGVSYPAARTLASAGAGPGRMITYHVYLPSGAPSGVQAVPYVSNSGWQQTFAPATSLAHGWNVVTWIPPPGVAMPLKAVGLQINDGPGYTGVLYLDDVSW